MDKNEYFLEHHVCFGRPVCFAGTKKMQNIYYLPFITWKYKNFMCRLYEYCYRHLNFLKVRILFSPPQEIRTVFQPIYINQSASDMHFTGGGGSLLLSLM